MRPAVFAMALIASACGGASRAGSGAMNAHDDSDPDFSRYAAAHGIQTLNGGGGGSTEASADDLRLEHLEKDKPVKLDGVLGEWPPLAKADVVVAGSGATTSMTVGLLYDEVKLYVGAEVNDPSFVAGQSHVSLLLAVPEPGGSYAPYELGIYPGKPGESEGAVRFGRRATVGGAKIVEATTAGGYTLEAAIPWIALPAARTTRVGIHGVARYASGENVIATGPGDAAHPTAMPWIPSEPELSMIEQLLGPKGLAKTAPIAEAVADLTGDGVRERVAVFDRYLTICGTSYLGGTGFFFRELAGELVKIEVRDVAGRGHADVIVRRREGVGDGTRETLEVLSAMDATTAPRVTFAHEIEVRQSDRRIDNVVRLGRGEIEVSVEPATGWDAASYKEPISSEVEPILLPWGAVRTQTWRWDGSRFAKAKEVLQPEARPGSAGAGEADDEAAPPRPAEPPTPAVTRGGDLSAQVLDAFRRDRGLSAEVRPKVDLQVQVTGDDHPERVLLIGRDIVVLGPGFKGGTGYSYTTLSPFADAADVKDLSARDLTGDGDADLVVRGVRHLNVDHAPFDSELLLVYQVDDGGTITRIFGIESGREQGRKRVQGLVQFVPSPGGRSFDILAEKGRAFGWTAKTYPWSQQADRGGDVEPLLLPWGSVSSVRYSWNGSQFAKSGD